MSDAEIEQHLGLVMYWANRYRDYTSRCNVDFEDIVQEGCIGLMNAYKGFQPDLGYRFSTYASIWIQQRIRRIPFSREKASDDYFLERRPPTDNPTFDLASTSDRFQALHAVIWQLPPITREIIVSHYGINRPPETLAAIARRIGITRERARQIKKQALERLGRKNSLRLLVEECA